MVNRSNPPEQTIICNITASEQTLLLAYNSLMVGNGCLKTSLHLRNGSTMVMSLLNSELLARSVEGLNLPVGSTLGSLTAEGSTLLIFLRHFG